MPRLAPFAKLVGLSKEAEKTVADALNAILALVYTAIPDEPVTERKTSSYVARVNDVARMAPGTTVSLPPANITTAGKTVRVIVDGPGTVSVLASPYTANGALAQGLVDGESRSSLVGPGAAYYTSNGAGQWFSSSSAESGAALASSSDDGDAPPWSAVLSEGPRSGANDAYMDVGRFINFGVDGPATGDPQLRSGDSIFRMRGSNSVIVTADGTAGAVASLTASGASAIARLAATGASGLALVSSTGTSGVTSILSQLDEVQLSAGTNVDVSSGGSLRLSIRAAGDWEVGGTPGAATQVLTSNGAGAPPTWQAGGGGGGTDPRIFAWWGV